MALKLLLLSLSLSFVLSQLSVSVIAQTQSLAEMQHGAWAGHDGAPQGVQALAISPAGLLWMGTMSGLYSFDGNTFVRFQPVTGEPRIPINISYLYFSRDGALWVFGSHDGPVRIFDGRTQLVDRTDGERAQKMDCPQQAPDGVIWALLNERFLVTLGADQIWHDVSVPGSGKLHLTKLFVDRRGTVWIVVNDQLYRRTVDRKLFEPTDVYVYGVSSFTAGAHADLWIASSGPATSHAPALHLQHVSELGMSLSAPRVSETLVAAMPAADESLWVLTLNSTLIHLSQPALTRSASFSLASSKDRVQLRTAVQANGNGMFLHPQDGSIWVGGLGGIERFADARLVPLVPNASPGLWENCVQRDGRQWFIDPHENLYVLAPHTPAHLLGHATVDLFCSAQGSLARDNRGLLRLSGNQTTRLPLLPGINGYSNHYIFTGAVTTPDGAIVATAAGGAIGRSLWRFAEGRWKQLASVRNLPEIVSVHVMADGQILFGLHNGDIGLLEKDAVRVLPTHVAHIGFILGFLESRYGPIAFGSNGIALLKEEHLVPIPLARSELSQLITGVVEAHNGDIWLNGADGIVRIPAGELAESLVDPSHQVAAENIRDGDYTGPSYAKLFCDRAQSDGSGTLWFSTLNGIVSIKPELITPEAAPPLIVGPVLADGHPPSQDRSFPPDVGVLSINYIGVDFSDPSSLSYAYRLEGYDHSWQNVGSRTEAVYTHLRAGRYTFQVKAENAYGIWTTPTALAPFTVAPHLYERRLFLAFCLLALAVFVWTGVQLRLRFVAANIRERAEARADERITIARDLHDTLLQGVQGLLLTLHAATERVPGNHESKHALERALASAEKLILEGRNRVKGLRTFGLSGQELLAALEAVADDLHCRSSLQINVVQEESTLVLHDHIASELFLIGREAIVNAYQHAAASSIILRLDYKRANFTLECEDNGTGFDLGVIARPEYQGRWGVRGMQERTGKIGGLFEISSRPGNGTLVRVRLPARKAYR